MRAALKLRNDNAQDNLVMMSTSLRRPEYTPVRPPVGPAVKIVTIAPGIRVIRGVA